MTGEMSWKMREEAGTGAKRREPGPRQTRGQM